MPQSDAPTLGDAGGVRYQGHCDDCERTVVTFLPDGYPGEMMSHVGCRRGEFVANQGRWVFCAECRSTVFCRRNKGRDTDPNLGGEA